MSKTDASKFDNLAIQSLPSGKEYLRWAVQCKDRLPKSSHTCCHIWHQTSQVLSPFGCCHQSINPLSTKQSSRFPGGLIVRRWNGLKKRHAAHMLRICCACCVYFTETFACGSHQYYQWWWSLNVFFVVAHHSPIDTYIIMYSTCKTEGVKLSEAISWSNLVNVERLLGPEVSPASPLDVEEWEPLSPPGKASDQMSHVTAVSLLYILGPSCEMPFVEPEIGSGRLLDYCPSLKQSILERGKWTRRWQGQQEIRGKEPVEDKDDACLKACGGGTYCTVGSEQTEQLRRKMIKFGSCHVSKAWCLSCGCGP